MKGMAVMLGDRFRVHAEADAAFRSHVPGASTVRIRVSGEPWWRVGEGVDDDGDAFVEYARMPEA